VKINRWWMLCRTRKLLTRLNIQSTRDRMKTRPLKRLKIGNLESISTSNSTSQEISKVQSPKSFIATYPMIRWLSMYDELTTMTIGKERMLRSCTRRWYRSIARTTRSFASCTLVHSLQGSNMKKWILRARRNSPSRWSTWRSNRPPTVWRLTSICTLPSN